MMFNNLPLAEGKLLFRYHLGLDKYCSKTPA